MIEIDGSEGEGGGQILRTAMALSALTGEPLQIRNIRAGRPRPGLAAQHLTSVRAVAGICHGDLEGDAVGSVSLSFKPCGVTGGRFRFDVGTAGSVTLVIQSCILALANCPEGFELAIGGGTDVLKAPPIDHSRNVLFPMLAKMGYDLQMPSCRRGFYPEGGGMVEVKGIGTKKISPLDLRDRGRFLGIGGLAYAQNLPRHVADRIVVQCKKDLLRFQPIDMRLDVSEGRSTGAGVVLTASYENTVLGASCLGERGLPSESVGQVASRTLIDEMRTSTLDVHAADQILPFMAIADGVSIFKVKEMSSHLMTQMDLIRKYRLAEFDVEGEGPFTVRVSPTRT